MTVSTATSRADYTGSAVLVYPYPFRIFADSDLSVYVDGTLQTLTTNYTVSGAGATGGGNVTFLASVNGKAVAIVRNVTAKQDVDLVENDPFSAETVEAALDRAEMVLQQLQEIIGRSLALATFSTQKNIVVDDLVAGKFLQVKTPATAGLQMVDITASGSIGIPVSIAQGGTGQITAAAAFTALAGVDVTAAFTTYTPTVTAASGTYSSVAATGRYLKLGRIVFIQLHLSIPSANTAAFPQLSLPFLARSGFFYVLSGMDSSNRKALVAQLGTPDNNNVQLSYYDATNPAVTGTTHEITGWYETAT